MDTRLAMAGIVLFLAAAAAPAPTPAVFVDVTPSTVEAPHRITVRASCPDNGRDATVESTAFGRVTVRPEVGFLTATATVPAGTEPRRYRVDLDCPGTIRDADSTLIVVAGNRPVRGPSTGFGGTAGNSTGTATITGGALALVTGLVLGAVALRRRPGRRRT